MVDGDAFIDGSQRLLGMPNLVMHHRGELCVFSRLPIGVFTEVVSLFFLALTLRLMCQRGGRARTRVRTDF